MFLPKNLESIVQNQSSSSRHLVSLPMCTVCAPLEDDKSAEALAETSRPAEAREISSLILATASRSSSTDIEFRACASCHYICIRGE